VNLLHMVRIKFKPQYKQHFFHLLLYWAAVVVTAVFLKHVKRHSKGINVVVTGACYSVGKIRGSRRVNSA
jgi:cobalamin synthase